MGKNMFPLKKHEVVSASVEVISEEKFAERLKDMSSCINCMKERSKSHRGRQRNRRKQVKSNSPIVICLKDTLNAALKHRRRVADKGERWGERPHARGSVLPTTVSITQGKTADARRCRRKDEKNLCAFLSVMQKAHQKDFGHIEPNLDTQDPPSRGSLLNNAFTGRCGHSSRKAQKRRSIAECENVDLICNDLSKEEWEKAEEVGESEDSSSISSGSDMNYDWENSVGPEDIERLAEYTAGLPLIRYNCHPLSCPQCLWMWYGVQYFQYSCVEYQQPIVAKLKRGEEEFVDEAQSSETESDGQSSSTESDIESGGGGGAVVEEEIPAKVEYDSEEHQCLDCVYIDLTDSDITFTVYYHDNIPKMTSSNYANLTSVLKPYYCSGYCTLPFVDIPPPLYFPVDISLPKTLMIPPDQLKHFNASQPLPRQWILVSQPDRSRPAAVFTVMCYNVLCDKYCTRQLYGYCPTWALNWEYRKKGIMDEIRNYGADIISLQEVETDQFYNFFSPELKCDGYKGIFSPKSRARTMSEQERKHVDGCAIFFRTSKFRLIKEYLIEFNQLAMANSEGSDDMLNRVMTKDNIGLAALLETKEGAYENGMSSDSPTGQPILVTTAHIHWDPEYSDVKLIQTMMLMWELKNIIEKTCQAFMPKSGPLDCNAIPLILCGDLNSLPNSGVIEYLSSGKVAADHEDFKELGYKACLRKITPEDDKGVFTHNFRLNKAYDNDVLPFTNYTHDFKGIIDYIFFSRDHMNLLGMLGPLDEDWFRENKVAGCPHPHIPSDHFSLFVELELPVSSYPNGRGTLTSGSTNNIHRKLR